MSESRTRGKRLWASKVSIAACLVWLLWGNAAYPQTLQQKARAILQAGVSEHNTSRRAAAVSALGLLQNDPWAIESAENALGDPKPAVRAAAATALGQMEAKSSAPLLKKAMGDKTNRVFFAAADSLLSMGDSSGYDVYYEILTGERKSGEGLIAAKKKLITDERAMVLLAMGVGIGFAPYASYGWMAWQELSKDYSTPVRLNALKKLANDPDSRIGEGLLNAACDKRGTVRVAALFAIGHHDDPSLLLPIAPHMLDKKAPVRYMAAAAVLRLSALVPADDETQLATRQ
ncbi:MAG: HEAT repeat domain-containing protein [Candidatus Acidiferrales bacterium]